jgi:hypothetical protein
MSHFNLGAASARLGALDEAHAAVRAGLVLNPGFAINRFRSVTPSDNPTFLAGRERIYNGMRMAGALISVHCIKIARRLVRAWRKIVRRSVDDLTKFANQATQLKENKVARATTKTPARKPYTAADVKLLKQHSKARTPVVKISKQMKRSARISETEGLEARNWPRSSPITGRNFLSIS